jgi:hypothetical protein
MKPTKPTRGRPSGEPTKQIRIYTADVPLLCRNGETQAEAVRRLIGKAPADPGPVYLHFFPPLDKPRQKKSALLIAAEKDAGDRTARFVVPTHSIKHLSGVGQTCFRVVGNVDPCFSGIWRSEARQDFTEGTRAGTSVFYAEPMQWFHPECSGDYLFEALEKINSETKPEKKRKNK